MNQAIRPASGSEPQSTDGLRLSVVVPTFNERDNVTALLWMTEVAATPEEVRIYLTRVLSIDPNNAPARKGLELMDKAGEP